MEKHIKHKRRNGLGKKTESTKILYSTTEQTEIIEYTDNELIKIVRRLVEQIDATNINLRFLDRNEYYNGILCSITNKENKQEKQYIYVYHINSNKEIEKTYLEEAQAIKSLLRTRFSELKITSNFRYKN